METNGVTISPVNMEDRKKLGIRSGDTVRVWQKIQEKGKTRLQAYEGLVLARKHGDEPGGTFTVRRVASGVGMEKIFPLYSPVIDKIEIVRRAKVRRAKLYYIREKVAREIKRQMRKMKMVSLATESEMEAKEAAEKAEEEAAQKAEAEAKAKEEAAQSAESEVSPVENTIKEEPAKKEITPETQPAEETPTPAEEKSEEAGEPKSEEKKKSE